MINNFNDIFAYILGALIICGMIYALFIELKTNIRDMKFDIKKEMGLSSKVCKFFFTPLSAA